MRRNYFILLLLFVFCSCSVILPCKQINLEDYWQSKEEVSLLGTKEGVSILIKSPLDSLYLLFGKREISIDTLFTEEGTEMFYRSFFISDVYITYTQVGVEACLINSISLPKGSAVEFEHFNVFGGMKVDRFYRVNKRAYCNRLSSGNTDDHEIYFSESSSDCNVTFSFAHNVLEAIYFGHANM